MRPLAFALALAAASVVAVAAGPAAPRAEALAVNAADLPDRCPLSRSYFKAPFKPFEALDAMRPKSADPDLGVIELLFGMDYQSRPELLGFMLYFYHATDYYARRAELQGKIEREIGRLPPERRAKAYANYGTLLMYLGESRKVLEVFGPSSPRGKEIAAALKMAPPASPVGDHVSASYVDFLLSQAYLRLGRSREAARHARRAYAADRNRDHLWQAMLSQLWAHGPRFFDKFSLPGATLKHVRELFPAKPGELPFEDVTETMGIDRWGGAGSASFVDFDGDGYDELVLERKFFPPKIYKNKAGGGFAAIPEQDMGDANCKGILMFPGDYDNDARPDLFRSCCNFDGPGPQPLLKNLGGLRFRDIAKGSGLDQDLGYLGAGMMFAWGDYDLDGRLDLVINDYGGPTRLYRNEGDGRFADVSKEAGLRQDPPPAAGSSAKRLPGGVGVTFGDFNNDRYPDLFIQGWGWKRLYRNKGDATFEDVTERAGFARRDNANGYMAFLFDYDNDLNLDIMAGQYVTTAEGQWGFGAICVCSNLLLPGGYSPREWALAPTIYRNKADGSFENMYQKTRFLPVGAMGYNHGDWNNDGYQDLVVGCGGPYLHQVEPFLFYENNGDGSFANKTPFTALPLWGKGHGVALGDYDNDGALDVLLNSGGFLPGDVWPSALLRNKGNGNHWIRVALRGGPDSNSQAIGAHVKVFAGGLQQMQELQSGGAFGFSSFTLHFGLGPHEKVDRVEIEWPNRRRTTTVLRDVAADQLIAVREGEDGYERLLARAGE